MINWSQSCEGQTHIIRNLRFRYPTGNSVLPQYGSLTAREVAEAYGQAYSRLACIAAGIVGRRDAAEDIVQEAIAIAIEKNRSFISHHEFVGWLAGIVKNCARNHRRKATRRKTYSTDPTNLQEISSGKAHEKPVLPSGELTPLQISFDDRVVEALNELSPAARCCILLRSIENLSYKEISDLMDIPEGTAMNLVHRGKKTLRELLATHLRTPGDSITRGGQHD